MCIVFFKQKTAYEMRISDWSSDVCSSDLEKVIVGDVAAGAILDPIAARVGAEQDQLEDAAALAFVGELGFDGILKFIEQDAGDPFQFAALGGGKMIEIGPHRHPIVAGVIASAGAASDRQSGG